MRLKKVEEGGCKVVKDAVYFSISELNGNFRHILVEPLVIWK